MKHKCLVSNYMIVFYKIPNMTKLMIHQKLIN